MRMLHLVLFVEETDIESLGEVLAEEMRRAALERTTIAHHRFHRVGLLGAGEALRRALAAGDERDRESILAKRAVYLEHRQRFALGLLTRRMRRVALLPEELQSAQEDSRP